MPNQRNAQEVLLTPEKLVRKAHQLAELAIKTGQEEIANSACELERDVIDYVQQKGRKVNVLKAFDALSELLTNPEFKKVVFIELIVKLMFEIFLYLSHMHV